MRSATPSLVSPAASLDIPRTLLKRWPIVLLGCIIAGVLAALYWLVAPRVYESTVEILVMRKDPAMTAVTDPIPSDGRSDVAEDVLATHIRLLGSRRVVADAIKAGELDQLPGVQRHLDRETTVSDYIVEHLDIGRGGKGQAAGAQVLHAEFRHTDEEETQLILATVVDAYQKFLDETFCNVGSNVFALYEKEREQLAVELQETQQKYADFIAGTPVILSRSEALDVYENQLVELTEARSLIEQQRDSVGSRLDLLVSSLDGPDAKDFTDADRLSLVDEQHVERLALLVDVERGDSISEAFQADQPARTEMANVEFGKLVSLQLEADELNAKFGSEHPRGKALADSIKQLERVIHQEVKEEQFRVRDIAPSTVVNSYKKLLENDLRHKERQLESLDTQIERVSTQAREANKYELQDRVLRVDLEAKQASLAALASRMPELGMTTQNSGFLTEIIAPVSLAEVAWPRLLQLGSLALALGLCGGVGGALYREMTDKTFESPAEVAERLDTPILGVMSKFAATSPSQGSPLSAKLFSAVAPNSLDAQTIRIIRTSLMHSGVGHGGSRVIQFTSPTIGEGTSVVLANVAVAIASTGKRVLVVDADMRRAEQHNLFGVAATAGLSELLDERAESPDVIVSTGVENLDLLPSGSLPSHPAELLAMPRFENLLASLRDQYDYILIDTPSVLAVSDAVSVRATCRWGCVGAGNEVRRGTYGTTSCRAAQAIRCQIAGGCCERY